ncbi:hypothetical protein [Metabacillus sp. FJAT-52054]|uniref:Lipoprotein n=1 Tax=Metabacillus sediminis TaxID=3117746 RepID=A0ABZ2NHG8_9BACI
MNKIIYSFLLIFISTSLIGCNSENTQKTKMEKRAEETKNVESQKEEVEIGKNDERTEQVVQAPTTEKIALSEEEKEYLKVFEDALDNVFLTDYTAVLDLLQEAENKSSLYKDENWKNEFKDRVAKIGTYGNVLREGDKNNGVPEKFKNINTLAVECTELVFMGGVAVLNGATNDDTETISNGINILTYSVNDKLDEINAEAQLTRETFEF